MSTTFQLKHPLPSRQAAIALRQQIIDHFVETRPPIGDPFLSDHQLARVAGLSRPTVRRALDSLSREGWIERRHGRGTYVGPRAQLATPSSARPTSAANDSDQPQSLVRMAVLVHMLGHFSTDWYSPAVLAGVDEVAGDTGVSIELVGDRDCDVRAVSNRLMQSRPNVLVCLAPAARHALLIGESLRLGIPVIGTGSFLTDLAIPTICEDGESAAADAVRHLVSQGHTRIGFVQMAFSLPMTFARHRGYLRGLQSAGLPDDESLVLWLQRNQPSETDRLRSYLKRCQPTAIVCGSCWPLEYLHHLTRARELSVPSDLSVITFDQHPRLAEWLGGVSPTTLSLPLREMGHALAKLARRAAAGQTPEKITYLPCHLQPGDSVRQLNPTNASPKGPKP